MQAPGVRGVVGEEDQAHAREVAGIGVADSLVVASACIIPAEGGRALTRVGVIDPVVLKTCFIAVPAVQADKIPFGSSPDQVADVLDVGALHGAEPSFAVEDAVPIRLVRVRVSRILIEDPPLVVVLGYAVALDGKVLLEPVVVDGRLVQDGAVFSHLCNAQGGGPDVARDKHPDHIDGFGRHVRVAPEGAGDGEGDGVGADGGVGVDRVLIGRGCAVTEVPEPGGRGVC